MSLLRLTISRVALLDAILLALALVLTNLWLAPGDFGWLRLNPTPFLVLPILIGARFGLLAGVAAGVFAGLIVMTGHVIGGEKDVLAFISRERFYLAGFILAGGLCGEIQHLFDRNLARLNAFHEDFRDRLKKLDNELYFLREAKSELDRLVATRDTELYTIETEIRDLYLVDNTQLHHRLIQLLGRHGHVTDAAVYSLQTGGQLRREAIMGSEKLLPGSLSVSRVEMAALALERRTVVTIPEFWNRHPGQRHDYLLAVPLLDFDENPFAVLLVAGMPFFSLNQKTVHLITVICKWVSKVIDSRTQSTGGFRLVDGLERQKIYSEALLKQNVELSYHSYRIHNIPSVLAVFLAPELPPSAQPWLERAVLVNLRTSDCPAHLELNAPNLVVLLPLTSESTANEVVKKVMAGVAITEGLAGRVEFRLFTFDQADDADELWKDLLASANEMAAAHP